MNLKSFQPLCVLSAAFLIPLLAGCGDASQKPAAPTTPAPVVDKAPVPETPPEPKGLGISQGKLMIGTGTLQLDQAEMKTTEGNVYMGSTSDDATKSAKLILYGSPEVVRHLYLVANIPYADFPDAAKYPDYMQANIKLQNTLLSNLFGGKIPDDVKTGLDWAKDNPGKDKVVTVDAKTVKLTYGADKKMSVDVK